LSKIFSLIKRDYKSLASEKTYISILVLQFLLFATARSFTAGVILLSEPTHATDIFRLDNVVSFGFVNEDIFSAKFTNQSNLLFFNSLDKGKAFLENDTIDLLVNSPNNLNGLMYENKKLEFDIYVNEDNPQKTLSLFLLKGFMQEFEEEVKFARVHERTPILLLSETAFTTETKELEVLYSFTIPLLLLFSAIISGSFVIDLITEEIEKKTYANLLSSPVSSRQILISKTLLPAIVTGIQTIFWIAIFMIQGIYIANLPLLVLFLFFLSILFGSIGLLVSSITKNNKTSQMVYTIILMLAMFFLTMNSNKFMPAFVVTKLSMSFGIDWIVLLSWLGASLVFFFISLAISSKRFSQIS